MLKSKIHHARVTQADLQYEGSFGIDQDFMDLVGIYAFEAVEIYNMTNGNRIKTYAIPLPRGSKRFESNGAAAHLMKLGDEVIIASYSWMNDRELQAFRGPKIAILDFQSNEAKKYYQPDFRDPGATDLSNIDYIPPSTATQQSFL